MSDAWGEWDGEEYMELVCDRMVGESVLFGEGKAALRRGSRRPGVVGIAILVWLLFADWVMLPGECPKPLLRRLKLSLVRTAGSMVLGDSSSGMVVA